MADLSKQLNTSPRGPETEEERKKRLNLQEALSGLSSEEIIDEMNRLSAQPEFQRKSYTPDARFGEQRGEAKKTYEEAQDRARTGEIISHLADAFSRAGAAAYGQNTGFDSSRVNFARPASFDSTKERNLQDYVQRIRELGEEEGTEKERARELDQGAREDYARKYEVLQDALRRAQKFETDKGDTDKEAARERRERQAKDDLLYREQRKDVISQGRALAEREQAANQLTNELLREDLKSKDKDKLAAKLGPVAAKAGIDLNAAIEKAQELKEAQPGFFGRLVGKKGASAEEQRASLFNQLKGDLDLLKQQQGKREERLRFSTTPMSLDEEEAIRKSAESVGAGGNTQQGPAPATQQAAPATVRIQAPDGSIAEVPRDKAQKYLDKGGKLVQ